MSTAIKSILTGRTVEIGSDGPDAWVMIHERANSPIVNVHRADFLAAVADECDVRIVPADAIVILREELPETGLTWDKRAVMVDGIEYPIGISSSAEEYREIAGRALALAEHLDANPPKPPVDEVQVLLISEALADTGTAHIDLDAQARRLYLQGVRIEAAK